MSEYIIMDVWIHSNSEERKPDSIEVLAMQGDINMIDYHNAFDKRNNKVLAEAFYEVSKQIESACKYLVRIEVENYSEPVVNVIHLLENLVSNYE